MTTKYLVDTDWVIEYLRGNPAIGRRLKELRETGLSMSIVTLAELYEGVYYSTDPEGNEEGLGKFRGWVTVLGIDTETCQLFAKERGRLRSTRAMIGDFDLLIGATALRHGLTLLTNNRKHFTRIQGLVLESN